MRPCVLSCIIYLTFRCCYGLALAEINFEKSTVTGPGLNVDSQIPTRYFTVKLVDFDGFQLGESAGQLSVKLRSSVPGGNFRGRVKVIDRKDGTYIINYRPTVPHKDLTISVQLNDRHIGESPYKLSGWLYQENCFCPMEVSTWMEALNCPANFTQLENDFQNFPKETVDMREVEAIVHEHWPKRPGNGALMHYVIKDNKVYRKDVGSITGFKMFSDAIFLSLTRKVQLPDVELFINLGDWPLVKSKEAPIPILSWCGSTDTGDIILPTYDITDATMKSLSGVSIDLISIQGETGPHWSNKIRKALFRGRDSRRERLDLVRMSRKGANNELIDAGITAFFFFPEDEGLKTERISFFDFFKYRYQLNIDGTVAAYRLPYLLLTDSVVLKQDSPFFEHFYADLQPWIHYIPVQRDLSDVMDKVNWARGHDSEAQRIALNAQKYMRENVTPANIYCYYFSALKKLADSLKSEVKVLDGMEEATHPDYFSGCACHRTETMSKDEL